MGSLNRYAIGGATTWQCPYHALSGGPQIRAPHMHFTYSETKLFIRKAMFVDAVAHACTSFFHRTPAAAQARWLTLLKGYIKIYISI